MPPRALQIRGDARRPPARRGLQIIEELPQLSGKKDDHLLTVVFAPRGTTHVQLAAVAGLRRTIEECFERARSDLGLTVVEAEMRSMAWGDKPNERSPAEPIAA